MKWWKKKDHKVTDIERKFNRLTDRFTALEANIYVISKQEEKRHEGLSRRRVYDSERI